MSRPTAEVQLERVLAMLPWLADHRGVHKDDVCARFGVSRDQLEQDLGLIMMIGVPPYSPGDYVSIEYDGDTVDVWLAPYFTRALRLTPAEGLTLLAAGRALLAVPGSDREGSLATALDKLAARLDAAHVAVDVGTPDHLEVLREAAADGITVEIEYWSAGRDDVTVRAIDPGPPFFATGQWYTDAYCHLRAESRMFRVDRIRAARPTDGRFEPVEASSPEALFHPRAGDPVVTLALPLDAAWVAESFPVDEVVERDGRLHVTLTVSELAWLERLLLRVGPEAEVLAPPELVDAGARAAERVLARYR